MRKSNNSIVEIECTVIRETDKAYLVQLDDGSEHWLPKSQVEAEVEEEGGAATIQLPEWLKDKLEE
jgi:RNase P/RNase MRP subunit p29